MVMIVKPCYADAQRRPIVGTNTMRHFFETPFENSPFLFRLLRSPSHKRRRSSRDKFLLENPALSASIPLGSVII